MPDERPDEPSAPRFGRRPRQGGQPSPAASSPDGSKGGKVRIGPRRPDASPNPPPAAPPAASAEGRTNRGGVRKPKSTPPPGQPKARNEGQNPSNAGNDRAKGGIRRRKDKQRQGRGGQKPHAEPAAPPPPAGRDKDDQLDIFDSQDAIATRIGFDPEGSDSGSDAPSSSPDAPAAERGLAGLSRNARRRKRRKDRRQAQAGSPSELDAFEPARPLEMDASDDVSFEEDESDFHVSDAPPPSGLSTVFPESSFVDTAFPGGDADDDDDAEDEGETSSDMPVEGGASNSPQQRESRSKRRRKKRRERQEPPPVDRASGFWWAEQWMRSFEVLYSGGASRARLQKGRSYARRGQVTELEVGPNGVLARVQGSRPKPYQVRLELNRLRRETWGRILHQLAGKAAFLAQLLEGTLPPEIEDVFFAAGARLFPHGDNDVRSRCTCPDPVVPCKHVAAVHYVLADALQRDPFLLFALRGKSRDQFLQDLREQRGREGGRREAPPAQAEDLGRFWRMGRLAESVLRPTGWGSGGDPARLIQSLGEPQLDGIREGLFLPLLESTYRQVSEGMRRLPKDG